MKPEIASLLDAMAAEGYVADPAIATSVYLAREMRRPLLVEGDAGVGKTELAKVLARIEETELIRLQCYEGLDVSTALYEWNYQRQLLRLRMAEQAGGEGESPEALEDLIFGRRYLLERPLLRAITREDGPPVLLIDEIDRADEGFEAFLLEVLSDFQVTVPELGTITARHVPHVVLTSNRTREIGDALRRRCLYLYVEHPTPEKEVAILEARIPGVSRRLAEEIARFMASLRRRPLSRAPGVAETLDWARALLALHLDHKGDHKGDHLGDHLDLETVEHTLGCVLKDPHDVREVRDLGRGELEALLAAAREPMAAAP